MIVDLVLPFPPRELNPNVILHWAKKAKIKAIQKEIGFSLSERYSGCFGNENLKISMIFYPSTKRQIDLDNCLASCKSILDGIAKGLRVNDKQFRPITIDFGKPTKDNPRVELRIET